MLGKSLHSKVILKKGENFLECGKLCTHIGRLKAGILRGFVIDNEGEEVTTHFYQEKDMVIGSFIPNVQAFMTIQAVEECVMSVADYSVIMSHVNTNKEITDVINATFKDLNRQLQSRLVSLLNLNSTERYELFLNEYPSLINRIPHYHIANFLGITPTQLSRARKQFIKRSEK